jgi:Mrp family chromosome partitioning ATPase
MLVIRAGRTHRHAVREALTELDTVGARVVGAVLNDPSGRLVAERQYYYAYAKP